MTCKQICDATLYSGDCLKIIPDLPDVDHVITDPPYEEITHSTGRITAKSIKAGTLDPIKFSHITGGLRASVAHMIIPKCSKWAMFFCSGEGVLPWKNTIEQAGASYKRYMIWVKPDCAPQFNGQRPALAFEHIVLAWCGPGASSWNGGGRRGVFTYPTNNADREGTHQTEKPLALMHDFVTLFTNSGDTILDPFMGSGTTGVACAMLDRKFIGIELDKKYYELACGRIEEVYAKLNKVVPEKKKGFMY